MRFPAARRESALFLYAEKPAASQRFSAGGKAAGEISFSPAAFILCELPVGQIEIPAKHIFAVAVISYFLFIVRQTKNFHTAMSLGDIR